MMMKRKISRALLLSVCMSPVGRLLAQQQPVEMADAMRSNGKIYIVVAVCLTILTGLFLYVWRLDRKIARMEKEG
jgi:CcmD family protein